MDKFLIQGGVPLEGEILVSGAKNSALPALAACLLTADRVTLDRIPPVRDIATMEKLLAHIGASVANEDGRVEIQASAIEHPEAPYELVKTMRASSLVLGPLVARCGTSSRVGAGRLRHRRATHQSARRRARAPGRARDAGRTDTSKPRRRTD